ncbi:MAG: zinc ribbon domain-containing protein [Candidatus Omnitrophica bacterium]|nr:zinc ribbon domain-containing protein [Candidatus Omnitrophota bacterium]
MPTYEYECKSCGHKFEKFQYMTAQPIKECPECHKQSAKRLIGSGAGIIFKGSGFYATDYRKDKTGKGKSKPGSCPAAKGDNPGCSNCPAH